MKPAAVLSLVLVLAVCAQFAIADECTAETCTSRILVHQNFDSPDCSGTSIVEPADNYTRTCVSETSTSYNSSQAYSCSTKDGFSITTSAGLNCPSSTVLLIQTTAIGVCERIGRTSSRATWCNAQSVGTPKALKLPQNVTVLPAVSPCNTTTGCGDAVGTMFVYTDASCNAESAALAIPPAFAFTSFGPRMNTCFVNNRTSISFDDRVNVYATCENGKYVLNTYTGGCGSDANLVSSSTVSTGRCVQSSSSQWITVTCSSASALTIAPFALIFFLAFLFI